jgi:hypothetical protein
MKLGPLPNTCRTPAGRQPDAMKPGIHCVGTHWIRGFMAFQLARRTRYVMLVVPVCPESGFLGHATQSRPIG